MTQKRAAAVCVTIAVIIGTTLAPRASGPLAASVFASGLKSPIKLVVTPGHNVLVSEGGDSQPAFVKNDGRISRIDPSGNVRTIIGNLPTGLDLENVNPSGPNGLWLQGTRTIYLQIGAGDVIKRNATNQEVPNPAGLSSALFSSVWRIRFSESVDWLVGGFALNPAADYAPLADGLTVVLTNGAGERASVDVLVDVRDIVPGPNLVSASNPFGLLVSGDTIYFPDAGYNSVAAVDRHTGQMETITHFPNVPNTAGFGPPVSQAVPNSIRGERGRPNRALVTLFSGFPFGTGASSVREVNLRTGEQTTLISGLTMAIDSLPLGHGAHGLLVLEHASGFVPPGPGGPAVFVSPGRILRFATPSSAAEVLVDGLSHPTSMDLDERSGSLFISEIRTGRIMKVRLY